MSLDDELVGGGGLSNPGLEELIVPSSATDNDPRVYVGQQDPIATGLSQDAAIVFYWGNEKAYLLAVEDSGGVSGQLHLWSVIPGGQLHQIIDVDHDENTDTVRVDFGQGPASESYFFHEPVTFQDDVTFNGPISFGPGVVPVGTIVGVGSDSAASAAIGAAETEILLTANPVTFEADTAYEVIIAGGQQGSVANANPIWRVRKSNGLATGQLAAFLRRTQLPTTADTNLTLTGVFATTNPAPAAVTMAVTMSALAGTVTNTATFGGRTMYIRKLGDKTDFPDANVLT